MQKLYTQDKYLTTLVNLPMHISHADGTVRNNNIITYKITKFSSKVTSVCDSPACCFGSNTAASAESRLCILAVTLLAQHKTVMHTE